LSDRPDDTETQEVVVPFQNRTAPWVLIFTVLVGLAPVSPAAAAPFTATWDFDFDFPTVPDESPLYDCPSWGAGGLICRFLWDQGLTVSGVSLRMYGDGGPFVDAFGAALPVESDISAGSGLFRIVPQCLVGLQPCFDTFTPLSMSTDPFTSGSPGGVFFLSSRGGLVTSFGGSADFSGPEWTDITSMVVGLFFPDECNDPESGLECGQGEQGLDITRLTFDATPVPEPASVLLVGTGMLALLRRSRRSRAG
jgi:hypothetical protein